jgi:TIR domain
MSDTLPAQPITIFCSYTHADESYKDALKKALAVPLNNGEISFWHDRLIEPGQEWDDQIKGQLSAADVILLMVSADFFASDYCQRVEVKTALDRHRDGTARVIPIVCRKVLWNQSGLEILQALPTDAKPIRSWPDQDEAYFNVAQGIQRVIGVIKERKK